MKERIVLKELDPTIHTRRRVQLVNVDGTLYGPPGPPGSAADYGTFYDTGTQTAASTTVAYPISFNSTDGTSGIALTNNLSGQPTRVTVSTTGVYYLDYSIQFANADNNTFHRATVWYRLNGTDIADSASVFSIPGRHTGLPGNLIASVSFSASIAASGYVELMWHTESTQVSVASIAAGTNPARPRSPGVILTAVQIAQ